MTKYAYYNSSILPNNQVIGWVDSDVRDNIPPAIDLFEMTEAQWEARGSDCFYVLDGVLTGSKNILSIAQSTKNALLSTSCGRQIVAGFISSALGTAYSYASTEVDQRNIVQSSQSSKGGLLSCQNTDGTWSRVMHTQAQAQQVLEDFVIFRDAARLKLQAYEAQVVAALSIAEVQAVAGDAENA